MSCKIPADAAGPFANGIWCREEFDALDGRAINGAGADRNPAPSSQFPHAENRSKGSGRKGPRASVADPQL